MGLLQLSSDSLDSLFAAIAHLFLVFLETIDQAPLTGCNRTAQLFQVCIALVRKVGKSGYRAFQLNRGVIESIFAF
jgi:hypothetical protein